MNKPELKKKIQKLFAQYGYNELVDQLLKLLTKWYDSKEALPAYSGFYLVKTDTGEYAELFYNRKTNRWGGWKQVVYWRPKEEKDASN